MESMQQHLIQRNDVERHNAEDFKLKVCVSVCSRSYDMLFLWPPVTFSQSIHLKGNPVFQSCFNRTQI